ncbi:MAG: diaminopimelate epimerase, partial [Deltaproteobacteria bacterium]|nr:diaminopimelate epimerase [Deltaproteobacteria bacterium]MBW2324206.1 diaminopimelate epimerase [Deltaproteobacteria bacterium]
DFYKMSGHGNDFILVDNRDKRVEDEAMAPLAKAVCRRRLSVGADGIIFIENGPPEVDFAWRFFNSDGSEAEMCGNGSRCAARFAHMMGIAPAKMSFLTLAGIIRAEVKAETIKVGLTQPADPKLDYTLDVNGQSVTISSYNTGVPHGVIFLDDVEAAPVKELGRSIRFHPHFQPAGINVNFTQVIDRGHLSNRTYERGVEDETLACGTGCIAAGLLAALHGWIDSPTRIMTRGGEELIIHFTKTENGFKDIFLEGPVRIVYNGRLGPEALI